MEKLDKNTFNQLKKFAQNFEALRERGATESDTVMFLVEFFKEVLGYDLFAGEISKEVSIKDKFCDIVIKLEGETQFLVEAKAAGHKNLRAKDTEQAENYASAGGDNWVLLTNGIEWQMYHVTFGEGIAHELAFETRLVSGDDAALEQAWSFLRLLSKSALEEDALEEFWRRKKALSPDSLLPVLFSMEVLVVIRRELNHHAKPKLDLEDVFKAIQEVLSKEAFEKAAGIKMPSTRKKHRKLKTLIEATPQVSETTPPPAQLPSTSPSA